MIMAWVWQVERAKLRGADTWVPMHREVHMGHLLSTA